MRALKERLDRLERRPGAAGMQVIRIIGGFRDDESGLDEAVAPGNGLSWTQREGEDLAAFRDRAIAEARQAGATTVIFGGFAE